MIIILEMGINKGERLFTPGPVEIPQRIREVLSRQIIHHRTPEFTESFMETRDLFKKLVDSPSDNFVFFSSSGTGAMESAILNFFKEGDEVIAIVGGKFGERWRDLAKTWGLKVIELEVEWGRSVDPEKVEKLINQNPGVKGVLVQMSESSTGAYHDVYAIAEITSQRDILLVVDAITALGVYNLKPQSAGIDVLVGGSQKAFMIPPGLSMVWFSDKAYSMGSFRGYYFNIKEELKKQKEGQTAFTPAIQLILALRESLRMLLEEGMERVEERYRTISKAMARSLSEGGIRIFPENPSISLTACLPPEGIPADEIRKRLLSMGIRVAGGQGPLKGKIFRISHMGVDPLDLSLLLSALEVALGDLGVNIQKGQMAGLFMEEVRSKPGIA